jgi:putative transposase
LAPKGTDSIAQGAALGGLGKGICGLKGRDTRSLAVPQSLARIAVHLVFSTKNREPLIAPDARANLHAYLAGACNGIECPALAVGGVADHVHILFVLRKTWSLSNAVEEIKTESSKWAKEHVHPRLYWQSGYGAFSVSASIEEKVVDYIRDQEEHHRKMTFQDELRGLFRKHGVAWDERYLWE